MRAYLSLLKTVLFDGNLMPNRTGLKAFSVFGHQIRFDLREGFPLVTTKKIHFKSVVHEMLWFLKGDTNIRYLQDNGVSIWDEWADKEGNLGRIYGAQWRTWQGANGQIIDQVGSLVRSLKSSPNSRRHILTAWNPAEIVEMALPPCHSFVQFYVNNLAASMASASEWDIVPYLSCHVYMRSCDAFLGLPFNIASYAFLTEMLAQVCSYKSRDLIISFGDLHIYENHLEQVGIQLCREPKVLPRLVLNSLVTDIFDFKYEDVTIANYFAHPAIKAEVAV